MSGIDKKTYRMRFAVVAMGNIMSLMVILMIGLSETRIAAISEIADSFLWINATIVLAYLGVSTVTKLNSKLGKATKEEGDTTA